MESTKKNILLTALRLFAADGYEAVSVARIAGELGITKGALYRHYTDKRDIFESILREMERRDAEQAERANVPEGTVEEMADAYEKTALSDIVCFSRQMFRYWTEDSFASPFRRMLTLEQYRSAEMAALYQQYLAAGPMHYVADLFASLGISEPLRAAAAFYGPMFLLYSVYDGAEDKAAVTALCDACIERAAEEITRERTGKEN